MTTWIEISNIALALLFVGTVSIAAYLIWTGRNDPPPPGATS